MIDDLTIVRAVYSGLSQRQVAATYRVSRNRVSLLVQHAKAKGWLTLEDLEHQDGALFSDSFVKPCSPSRDITFKMPDYEWVHAELAKPHVTLKLLWEEYVEQCRNDCEQFYMETQFRYYYHSFARVHKATIRLEHKPALSLEVDWAGTKIAFFDSETGKPSEASLFVSVLPCSQLTGKNESRWSSYLAEEKDFMLSLPESPYELAKWGKAKVQPNCHIAYQNRFYSVPFEHLGEEVDVRATHSTIEIFYHHVRVASHKRLYGKSTYATIKKHMPPDKLFFADWDRNRFLAWAEKVGPATKQVIEAILDRAIVEQQAYRSCFGLLTLKDKYSAKSTEQACAFMLSQTKSPTYQQVKNVLGKNADFQKQGQSNKTNQNRPEARGFQRGADYFGGGRRA